MFSSSNNSYNPFHFIVNQNMTGNPNSTPEDQTSLPFFHFPVPFLDDDADEIFMSQLLSEEPILVSSSNGGPNLPTKETNNKKVAVRKKRSSADGSGAKAVVPRKRTGKKDRHSKIYTSQGPRDRRMRLSLQIARKFFDLQDMLGFDKASKTIEWLFSKSKVAINELTDSFPRVKESCSGAGKTVSSTSESEVVSVAKETEEGREQKGKQKKERKSSLKASINIPVPKESREKARARARERTREKMKIKLDDVQLVQSSSPHESGENFGASSQTNSTWKAVVEEEDEQHHRVPMVPIPEHQMDSVNFIEKFLGINTSAPTSSSVVNLSTGGNSEEIYPVFTGNWSMNSDHMQYSYCAMTNMKGEGSSGNVIQVQSPNTNFMANSNTQEQNPSTVFMFHSEELNPNSIFETPSNVHEGNPTSVLVSSSNIGLHSHFQENHQFCSNHLFANKHCNFY
ncbi:hypothetical protein SLE2022_096200 [Rubroshorea leprosula]